MVIQDATGRVYPADRCAWRYPVVNPGGTAASGTITDSDARTNGYYVFDVDFFDGVGGTIASPVTLSGRPVANLSGNATNGGVVTLGQIGKSGRFVALSNEV